MAIALVAVVAACGSPSPTPQPTVMAVDPNPSKAPSAEPAATSVDAVPSATAPLAPAEPSIAGRSYLGMPISLEMTQGCGLCGPAYWLAELPRFRLYADGMAVFRGPGDDPSTTPYRFVQLEDQDFEALLGAALDDGGLRGAESSYPGNADDVGAIRFALHAMFFDDDANVDVEFEPVSGSSGNDRFGDPIKDQPRRDRLASLAALLGDFEAWLAARGGSSHPLVPEAYAAAIFDSYRGDAEVSWPLGDIAPDVFGLADNGASVKRIPPALAAAAGVGIGGGELHGVAVGDGLVGSLLIRPVLPGDDRPGMFGLQPDTVALTLTPDLRVRSLPEVSDQSAMLTPLLRDGDSLYVISGPVAGSGYQWYEVHAPRAGLTGWVAAASKSGEAWIRSVPLQCDLHGGDDPNIDLGAYGVLLHRLACFGGVEFSDVRSLGPVEGDGLRCPDTFEWIHEPEWLDNRLICGYEFRPEEIDTGGVDLFSDGILHPSIADVPDDLLAAQPDGLLVEVTARYDHPDARDCRAVGSATLPSPAWVRLECRLQFVITEMRPLE